jgi:hypothetical protein
VFVTITKTIRDLDALSQSHTYNYDGLHRLMLCEILILKRTKGQGRIKRETSTNERWISAAYFK